MFVIKYPSKGIPASEGVVSAWSVKEGNLVKNGDFLAEIEVFGAVAAIESTINGTLRKIIAPVGTPVKTGDALAVVGRPEEDISCILAAITPQSSSVDMKNPVKAETSSAVSAAIQKDDKSNPVIFEKKEEVMTPPQPIQSGVSFEGVIPVLMPQAGQTMEEGTILSWKVKEGDRIAVGQVIMEIETDKAAMEVEAVDAGRIAKIIAPEGAVVPVKTPVAYLAEEGVDIDALLASGATASAPSSRPAAVPAAAESTVSAASRQPVSVSETGRVKASPAARKIARDKGIDLAAVAGGSGPGGRILSTDVQAVQPAPEGVKTYAVSKMRRAIANNLLYSKQNIPHFYAKLTIDAGSLYAVYRRTKEQFKCSINDFITAACARAIRQYPAFRSQYKDGQIVENPAVNIGIAVGTENGLTVPVVLNADRMNLEQLALRTRQIVEAARNGRLEGIGQGVFTITNLGMFGVEEFAAIINPPESAILAVGALREGTTVENGAIRAARLMTMTLSVDHRVIDGVLAAEFLKAVKELLEKPEQLI